mmetsp:Transcript_32045/g.69158  ORF Transcript_32045/g.69158 Transcript_32045/m.69158 type:complete len:205 (+) Transcript_32045:697-1311(+)
MSWPCLHNKRSHQSWTTGKFLSRTYLKRQARRMEFDFSLATLATSMRCFSFVILSRDPRARLTSSLRVTRRPERHWRLFKAQVLMGPPRHSGQSLSGHCEALAVLMGSMYSDTCRASMAPGCKKFGRRLGLGRCSWKFWMLQKPGSAAPSNTYFWLQVVVTPHRLKSAGGSYLHRWLVSTRSMPRRSATAWFCVVSRPRGRRRA